MKSMTSLLAWLSPAIAQPDWCRWVPLASQPYVPACSYAYPGGPGYANFGCATWCQWVPGPSWGYTSGCGGCYGLYSTHYEEATVPATALQSGCVEGCQWVSRPSWVNASDCQKCEQPMVLDSESKVAKTGLKVKAFPAQPDWCRWVPLSSIQYVGECMGAIGPIVQSQISCANWCTWVPSSSWQYTPECSRCTGQGAWTSGAQTGCVSWCQWVPRPSWQHTPDCFQCDVHAPMPSPMVGANISNISGNISANISSNISNTPTENAVLQYP